MVMTTETTDVKMAAWRALLVAHAEILGRLGEEMETETGLSLDWYEVLLLLFEAEDEHLRMHELAASMLTSRSAATRLVDRMVAAGLVRRFTCETDRRGTFVTLTDSGRAQFLIAGRIHRRGITEHFSKHIDPDEARRLVSVMERLAEVNRRAPPLPGATAI